ncbi:MAG TPA: hypothetical protein VGE51_01400 [Fontimonas sp.]
MTIRPWARCIALVALSTQLAACGGGGSGGTPVNTPALLGTKDDVARELGNLIDFIALGDNIENTQSAQATWRPRVQSKQLNRARLAKAAVACDSGSANEETGSAVRDFELFPVSRSVEFTRRSSDNCSSEVGDGTTITFDGVFEDGQSAAGSDGLSYDYFAAGSAGSPVSLEIEADDGEFSTLSTLGVIETASDSAASETRVSVAIDATDSSGYSSMAQVGDDGDPLIATITGTRISVSGPYRYSSTLCSGGAVRVATPSELTFGVNGYPNGGELRLTAGTQTATVRINLDNSATVQLPDGSTQTISSSEARSIFDNGSDC